MGTSIDWDFERPLRLRFAPSPTGSLHVGGARTALFNYLLARHSRGTFILRIEDTDATRNRPESEAAVMADLRWLGLSWDEGPDCGGAYGPYRQSERLPLYADGLQTLLDRNLAYHCYCTTAELEQDQAAQKALGIFATRYGGRCARLSAEEQAELQRDPDRPKVLRLRIPPGQTVVEDGVHGKVVVENAQLNDIVLTRTNGIPTYNFAAAYDDALMKIDLVVRGDEHLANTPYQLLVLAGLGLPAPRYAHVPLILNEDHQKLSKRHETVGVASYREQGYLPEALLDHLVLLGWSPGDDSEHWVLEKLAEIFSLERVGRSPSVYNAARLKAFNARAIRALPRKVLAEALAQRFQAAGVAESDYPKPWLYRFIEAYGEEFEILAAADERLQMLIGGPPQLDEQTQLRIASPAIQTYIQAFKNEILNDKGEFSGVLPNTLVSQLAKTQGLSPKEGYQVLRLALTGEDHGAPFALVVELLGPARVQERLTAVIV